MESPFLENQELLKHLRDRAELFRVTPEKIYPWWIKTCEVNVLLLTDGQLDFGPGDFGLSASILHGLLIRTTLFLIHHDHR